MAAKKPKLDKSRQRRGTGLSTSDRVNLRKSESYVSAAQAAWERQQYERAIALYKEALRRDARNAKLMIDIARAYGLRQDYDTAQEYLARALRSDPRRARIQFLAGESYRMINRPGEAADCFQRVLQLNPSSPDAPQSLVSLAFIYERRHQLDKAREAIDRALAIDSGFPAALLQLAIVERRSGNTAGAESQLRDLVRRNALHFQIASDAWYELGQLLDAAGEYVEAFTALENAKRLLRPHTAHMRGQWEGVRQRNERMLQSMTAAHFMRWHESESAGPPLRLALMTSHPRSGTTLAEQVLDSHPDLVSADEFNTFTDWVFLPLGRQYPSNTSITKVLDDTPREFLNQVRRNYWARTEAMLGEHIGSRMLMDKNPELTYLLPVASRVFPEMKILFPLRDPRDVVLSCFMQKLPLNAVSVNYLTLQNTAEKYAHVMRTWLAVRQLIRAAWLEFRYEDTVADVRSQAGRLLEFLGLDWDERVLQFHEHAREKMVRSPTYEAVTKPVHNKAVGRWRNYERQLAAILPVLEPYLREFGYD